MPFGLGHTPFLGGKEDGRGACPLTWRTASGSGLEGAGKKILADRRGAANN